MKWISGVLRQGVAWGALVALVAGLSGCATNEGVGGSRPPAPGTAEMSGDILRSGDRIRIVYNDIPDSPTPVEQIIPDDGKMLLPRGVEVVVTGKRRTDVEREIAGLYVSKNIYRKITVTIERMASFVSVGGEVRVPNSIVYRGDLTVLGAIDAAGGFSEYARRTEVIVTRAATQQQIKINARDAVRNPQLNVPLYPGDSVYVPRSRI